MEWTMDDLAVDFVCDYVREHHDDMDFTVFIVWKCKTVQNWKYILSTTLHDGMIYEVTYNGDACEWYVDVYHKIDKKVIPYPTVRGGR